MHLMQHDKHSRRAFLRRSGHLALMGAAAPLGLNLAAMGEAAAFNANDYKALVCVFLFGGNDHANTVVAYDNASHAAYARIRAAGAGTAAGSIALQRAALDATRLQPLAPLPGGVEYALHPRMTGLAGLFNTGRAAVQLNVGPLVVPTTRQQYMSGAVPLPPKLFSHNDQQSVWQSQGAEGSSRGWGGNMGDLALGSNGNALFTCIYLFHMAIFCTASGLVAKFSLRKLVTQQLWLYLISQAGITAFRAAALKDNIVDQGGWLQNVLLPWRHMWYLYALMFWMLTVPLLRAIQRRGLLASTVGMAAAIAIGLLGGCVNWPFDLGRVFSFFPFFAFGVLFAEPFRSWQKRWYAWGPLAAAIVVFYTVTVQRIVTAETPVYEGARIFQSDAYAVGGYLMQDRAVFYLLGFGTVLAITPILGLIKPLASLGQRTLPIYILHMPLYALLVQLGCYEACASHGLLAVITWLCFIIPAVVALCASAPVCAILNGIANIWYKTLPALFSRRG